MSESRDPQTQLSRREIQHQNSPPSSPSSPDPTESDTKLSRKREREVSLEPATTPKAAVDVDPLLREHKETSTPAKKNRTHLDTTEEEEDVTARSRSNSHSPPISISPPQEMKMKVRQISQGVEDLSWRNMKAITPEKDIQVDYEATSPSTPDEERVLVDPEARDTSVDDDKKRSTETLDQPSLCSDSDSAEKGLKRKFLERGTSQGPPENGDAPNAPVEPLKRARDNADQDDNPRETKRPSPPPEPKASPNKSLPVAPKLGGFMAYASTTSPFAAVKGQNIFSSYKPPPSPPPNVVDHKPVPPLSTLSTNPGEPSSSTSTMKRSGFEAFASWASPYPTVATRSKSPAPVAAAKLSRNKSPPRRTNSANSGAFSSYAGGVQSFAIPVQKRARAGSPNGSTGSSLERNSTIGILGTNGGVESGAEEDDRTVSFGEKLRAGRDDEDEGKSEDEQSKVVLTEQDLTTGEEEEETVHQVRGKLFSLADGNQWKERGTGTLKLNVRRSDGSGARLVMRKEAVYTLLLNVTLFQGMRCALAQDPRYLRFSVIEHGTTTHYNLRVASAKIAQELLEEIKANVPTL